MKSKINRPFMLSGIIMALVGFIILTISSIGLLLITFVASDINSQTNGDSSTIVFVLVVLTILSLAISISGIICSLFSIIKFNKTPEKQATIIATLILSIVASILIFVGIIENFDVLSLVVLIDLIFSSVFILIDLFRKNKLPDKTPDIEINEEKTEQQIKN